MNFPRFWAKGQVKTGGWRSRIFESWGWSDNSSEEAKRRGDENARRVADRFATESGIKNRHRQYYLDRPFREEVLERLPGDGSAAAIITRNSYGCQVLNTARLMFVDVDLDEDTGASEPRSGWFWERLTNEPKGQPPKDQQIIIDRAREWAEANPGWGWRVYRTRAGLRFLATHELFDPEAMAASSLFDALTADVLYRKLCQNQKCFRARLTPKPWRCGVPALSVPWPWNNARAENRFLAWEKTYLKATARFSTCDLVATLGNTEPHPAIAPIIEMHDQKTRVGSGLPLA